MGRSGESYICGQSTMAAAVDNGVVDGYRTLQFVVTCSHDAIRDADHIALIINENEVERRHLPAICSCDLRSSLWQESPATA